MYLPRFNSYIGEINRHDQDFLVNMADKACGKGEGGDGHAIFMCVQRESEINTILGRFRENGCRPSLLWTSLASTKWSKSDPEKLPFILTGKTDPS